MEARLPNGVCMWLIPFPLMSSISHRHISLLPFIFPLPSHPFLWSCFITLSVAVKLLYHISLFLVVPRPLPSSP